MFIAVFYSIKYKFGWRGMIGRGPRELARVAAGEAAGYGCDFQNIDESGRLIPIIFLTRSYRGCQR